MEWKYLVSAGGGHQCHQHSSFCLDPPAQWGPPVRWLHNQEYKLVAHTIADKDKKDEGMRAPRKQISPERHGLFTVGTVLMVIGICVVAVTFIGFVTSSRDAVGSHGPRFDVTMVDGKPVAKPIEGGMSDPFHWWVAFAIGLVVSGVGAAMRGVAARGVAGSGLVLDPERARSDLEPWARMGGGMLKDAIEESGLPLGKDAASAQPAEPVVKIRCPKCRALNDEIAKFCGQCAAPL